MTLKIKISKIGEKKLLIMKIANQRIKNSLHLLIKKYFGLNLDVVVKIQSGEESL